MSRFLQPQDLHNHVVDTRYGSRRLSAQTLSTAVQSVWISHFTALSRLAPTRCFPSLSSQQSILMCISILLGFKSFHRTSCTVFLLLVSMSWGKNSSRSLLDAHRSVQLGSRSMTISNTPTGLMTVPWLGMEALRSIEVVTLFTGCYCHIREADAFSSCL